MNAPSSTMRRRLARGALIFFGTLSAVTFIEISLMVFLPQPYPGYNIDAPSGSNLYAPDFNLARRPLGVRGLESWGAGSENAVLLLGDSFIANMIRALEPLTRERHLSDSVEFVNGGAPTFGTGQELALYRARWAARGPHWVVLGFYIGNDFLDNTAYSNFVRQRSVPQRLNLVRLMLRSAGRIWPQGPPGMRHYPKGKNPSSFYRSELERELCIFKRGAGALTAQENAATLDYILSLKREVVRRGGRLAVILIPRDVQVEPIRVFRHVYRGTPPASLDLDQPNRRLMRFLKTHRIPTLDLLPELRALAKTGPLYRYEKNDIHWNKRGDKEAARLILDWFLSLNRQRDMQ